MSPDDWEFQCQTCSLVHLRNLKGQELAEAACNRVRSTVWEVDTFPPRIHLSSVFHIGWLCSGIDSIPLHGAVTDLALECQLERPEITAEESQGYIVGCSGAGVEMNRMHNSCRKPQKAESFLGFLESPHKCPQSSASNIHHSQREVVL